MPKRKSQSASHSGDSAKNKSSKTLKKGKEKAPEAEATTQSRVGNGLHDDQDENTFCFSSPKEAFSHLIKPIDVDTFFQEYWEKKPLIISRNNSGDSSGNAKPLFSRSIMEKIIAERRIYFGSDCNVCRYVNGMRESLNGRGQVKGNQVKQLFNKQATWQFHQPQRFQDDVWQLLEQLESFFGCLVGANVYITPKDSQGLAPHYDDVEVFILQLEGEKHWGLYNPPITLPRDYSPDLDQSEIGSPTHDIVLKAGDVMYFPRGTVHQADTPKTCSHSTHLTISTYQRAAWGDILTHSLPSILESAISEVADLRCGLPLQFFLNDQASSDKTSQKLKELIGHLGNHIGSHGQEAANEMLCDFIANRLPPYSRCGAISPGPYGPMPTGKDRVCIRFPHHTVVVRKCQTTDEEKVEEEEEEEDEGEDEDDNDAGNETTLFIYHALQNSQSDHMMSGEPRQPTGIQLPIECEASVRHLIKLGETGQRVADISLQKDIRMNMLMSLWAEGLLVVKKT